MGGARLDLHPSASVESYSLRLNMTEEQKAKAFVLKIQRLLEWRKMGLNYGTTKALVINPVDIYNEAKKFIEQNKS